MDFPFEEQVVAGKAAFVERARLSFSRESPACCAAIDRAGRAAAYLEPFAHACFHVQASFPLEQFLVGYLPPALRPAQAAVDRVVVGVRPERLSLEKRGDDVALSGQVALREVLGAEVVLHLESQAGPLTVRADAASAPRQGDTVQVWLDPRAIHLFDGATEARL